MKVSKKWRAKVLPLYKEAVEKLEFANITHDFSDQACEEYFNYESKGGRKPDLVVNGCARGKFLLDQHLGMWKEGIKEELFSKKEFLSSNDFSLGLCEFINKGLYQ